MDGRPPPFRKVCEFFFVPAIFAATAAAWISGCFEKFLVQIERLFHVEKMTCYALLEKKFIGREGQMGAEEKKVSFLYS